MGVKGLWKIVGQCGEQEIPHDSVLAVDTSIWIHQYKGLSEVDAVYLISKKIIKLLYHNISPVFIFDGPPNPLKKRVIEERKKEKTDGLIRDIINNVQCKKCKIKLRTCIHGGLQVDNFTGELEGNEKWGEIYEKHERTEHEQKVNEIYKKTNYEQNFNKNTVNEYSNMRKNSASLSEINEIREMINSESLTTPHKLKMLVKMRERRKNRFQMNTRSMDDFSKSQIKNIKSRNLVSYYIKKLESQQNKKIGSDCKKTFTLQNSKMSEIKEPADNSSSEINDFLEINEETEINSGNNFDYEEIKEDVKSTYKDVKSDFKDEIVFCKTKPEKYNNGFFGESDNSEEISENKIEYDFNKTRPININNNVSNKEETMDFLSIQSIIKDILKVFKLPFLDSPSESDSQCAFLYKSGLVDGVITEDNDILLHGGVVYKNFFRKNKSILKYDPKKIEEKLGLTLLDLIHLGYVLGSDYTVGIKGVGIKKALEYIRSDEYKTLNTESYVNIYLNSPVREDWKPKFQVIEFDKVVKYWITSGLDKEKIDELEFYIKNNKL